MTMAPKEVVLVTGANTGLGFQIIRALCGSNKAYEILLAGRSLEKAQQAAESVAEEFPSSSSEVWPIQIDLEDDDSVQRAFDEVQTKFGRLDALVNNAGAQLDQQLAAGNMTMRQMWNKSWNVNTSGTQIITSTFIPLLLRSNNARLLFITSGTSTLAGTENLELAVNKYPPKGWPKSSFSVPAYRSSKTGMNMMMREWHRVLKQDGVKTWCLSPGFLATGLGGGVEFNRNMGAIDPTVGGIFVLSVLEGQRDGDTGKVLLRNGVQAW